MAIKGHTPLHPFCGRSVSNGVLLVNWWVDFPISTGLPISQTPKRGQQKGVRSIFQSPPSKGHTPYIQGHTPFHLRTHTLHPLWGRVGEQRRILLVNRWVDFPKYRPDSISAKLWPQRNGNLPTSFKRFAIAHPPALDRSLQTSKQRTLPWQTGSVTTRTSKT